MALRILHLNSRLTGGGTDDQCVKLAAGLRGLGQSVWIAGPDGREFSRVARELSVPFAPTGKEGPLKLVFVTRVARLIRKERIQVVHGHHGRDLWPAILAARWSGVRPRIVLTRHMAKSPSSWASRHFLLAQCDALIAVSQFVAKVLREGVYEPDSPEPERRARPPLRGDHSKIHVIYGGIDTERFRPLSPIDPGVVALRREWGLASEHFAFGVVGGFDLPRGKGQREFLRAAAQIHTQAQEARFLLVGRGSLKERLEQDIRDLGLTGKARLVSWCDAMPAAMNALDCLVHPQVGTEAMPGVVGEAFACGKPVIASALDGIPEAFAVGHHGQLVPPENVEALAHALACWCRLPALAEPERLALHRRVVEVFSAGTCAAKVAALYQGLLARSR